MAKLYDVVSYVGELWTGKDGKERRSQRTIGEVYETKAGPVLHLKLIPLGWDGRAFLNEPIVSPPGDDIPR